MSKKKKGRASKKGTQNQSLHHTTTSDGTAVQGRPGKPDDALTLPRPVESLGSSQRPLAPVLDLNQIRQRFAWRDAQHWNKETATRIQSLPLQLRTQGLSTTVAVLLREDRKESRTLVAFLAEWLLDASPTRTLASQASTTESNNASNSVGGRHLLQICLDLPIDRQDDYLAAQDDALTLLAEAKLLASALHPSEVYRDR